MEFRKVKKSVFLAPSTFQTHILLLNTYYASQTVMMVKWVHLHPCPRGSPNRWKIHEHIITPMSLMYLAQDHETVLWLPRTHLHPSLFHRLLSRVAICQERSHCEWCICSLLYLANSSTCLKPSQSSALGNNHTRPASQGQGENRLAGIADCFRDVKELGF